MMLNGHIRIWDDQGGGVEIRAVNFHVPEEWPARLLAILEAALIAHATITSEGQ